MSATIRPTAVPSSAVRPRSVAAVAGALVLNALVAAACDQLFVALGVYPPWGQITYAAAPYLIALAYRFPLGVGAAYLAARWAPSARRRHAMWLGVVGTMISAAGLAAALTHDVGPAWYPTALLLGTLPCAWLGGRLHRAR